MTGMVAGWAVSDAHCSRLPASRRHERHSIWGSREAREGSGGHVESIGRLDTPCALWLCASQVQVGDTHSCTTCLTQSWLHLTLL